MSFRPYPNVDRALAQVARRRPSAPVIELECLRPMGEALNRLRTQARERVKAAQPSGRDFGASLAKAFAAPPVDEYRISTR